MGYERKAQHGECISHSSCTYPPALTGRSTVWSHSKDSCRKTRALNLPCTSTTANRRLWEGHKGEQLSHSSSSWHGERYDPAGKGTHCRRQHSAEKRLWWVDASWPAFPSAQMGNVISRVMTKLGLSTCCTDDCPSILFILPLLRYSKKSGSITPIHIQKIYLHFCLFQV